MILSIVFVESFGVKGDQSVSEGEGVADPQQESRGDERRREDSRQLTANLCSQGGQRRS